MTLGDGVLCHFVILVDYEIGRETVPNTEQLQDLRLFSGLYFLESLFYEIFRQTNYTLTTYATQDILY